MFHEITIFFLTLLYIYLNMVYLLAMLAPRYCLYHLFIAKKISNIYKKNQGFLKVQNFSTENKTLRKNAFKDKNKF